MKKAALLLCASLAASCSGSSPVAPTPPPPPQPVQVAGGWSGTFESQTYATAPILVDLNQIGSSVTGTWVASGGQVRPFGNITGTVDQSSFIGTVTYNYVSGPTCFGSFSGSATSGIMNWMSPGFTTGSCGLTAPGNPVGVRFVLQRR